MINRFLDRFANQVGSAIAAYLTPERVEELKKGKQYYEGVQKAPLRTKPGQLNDNLITNYIGLAVDRANSMLFGGGVKFVAAAGGESEEQQYLDAVWNANKQPILLHRAGQDGELFGTPYIKIVPDGLEWEGLTLSRLVLLDPQLMAIETDPMDMERVTAYIFETSLDDGRGVREITRRADPDGEVVLNEFSLQEGAPAESWIVETWERNSNSSTWLLMSSQVWPYPFPPIIHWQNLPSVHSVYGIRGIEGVLELQDKYNFVVSNILKIIRYHAHPKTWGRGFPSGTNADKASWGPDEMIKFSSENAMIANLEMQSDLASSRAVAMDLRQQIFDITRNVDISSITDKVGALTNFGLRVLYSDALSKNATRRQLYGDALEELNRRLLLLAGFADGRNQAEWGSDLPQDEKEDAQLIREDLLAGLVSHETAATKRGYQWKTDPNSPENLGEEDKIAGARAKKANAEIDALSSLFSGRETPETAPVSSTDTPTNINSEKGLNGAQITSAVELLKNVSAGIVAPEAARELLTALGIDEARVDRMIEETKTITIDPGQL